MTQNVGTADRWIRLLAGTALIIGSLFVEGAWRWIAVPGVVSVLTAIVRVCPAYWLLRIRTLARPRHFEG